MIYFNNASIELSNYISKKEVRLSNNSWLSVKREMSVTFAGFYHNTFIKCFGMEVSKNKKQFVVNLKNTVFPNGQRPLKFQAPVIFHYRNEATRSLPTIRSIWPVRKNNDSYIMAFLVKAVEVVNRRNKKRNPCVKEWDKYDEMVLEEHIKSIGCRAPYQNLDNFPICENKQDMKKVAFHLDGEIMASHPPPCREATLIDYNYREIECIDDSNCSLYKGHLRYALIFGHTRYFKEITQTKKIDGQTLIGSSK